jgi:hypothetical protein
MSSFNILNLGILLREYEESEVKQKMMEFDCPKNSEINDFFHYKAIGSVQRHQTATFLVVDNKNQINGFYSLTHKSLEVSATNLSKTYSKKIAMYSDYDESKNSYYISAFLIAQFGKNSNISKDSIISGDEMMNIVIEHLRTVRDEIAGNLVYLECEENESLLNFYSRNGFIKFGERFSKNENVNYIQMLRFL